MNTQQLSKFSSPLRRYHASPQYNRFTCYRYNCHRQDFHTWAGILRGLLGVGVEIFPISYKSCFISITEKNSGAKMAPTWSRFGRWCHLGAVFFP